MLKVRSSVPGLVNMPLPDDALLQITDRGLYCPSGDFYVDPSDPVDRAVVTHAHGDHAARGCDRYLTSDEGEAVLQYRMGDDAEVQTILFGETLRIGDVEVSLHPAGHVRGSAQVRLAPVCGGDVWVVTGDYKVTPDPTCTPFELVECDVFITECTFGLPIYRWPSPDDVFDEINAWWRENAENGVASVLLGYSLGKAQRLLMGVDPSIGPIYTHGAVENMNDVYRADGVDLPATTYATGDEAPDDWGGALIVAPSSAGGSTWMRRFEPFEVGFASGWMTIRGRRRRRSLDRGFVLSDHVDWPALTRVIEETGAHTVYPTHGYNEIVARWLNENGTTATPLPIRSAMDGE